MKAAQKPRSRLEAHPLLGDREIHCSPRWQVERYSALLISLHILLNEIFLYPFSSLG